MYLALVRREISCNFYKNKLTQKTYLKLFSLIVLFKRIL